jgi:propanol-preferring alcohol dehydrogenase
MKAVSIVRPGERPVVGEIDRPEPGTGEVLIEVEACGVCRTDLHLADGEIPTPKLPVVPGHEIVGRVVGRGIGAGRFEIGDRVGVPWLGWTCGECEQCLAGRENL